MTHKEYNGWTNYETWVVNLWMDNEEGTQDYWRERAADLVKHADGDKSEAELRLAEEIEEQHREAVDSAELKGFMADMMGAAMSEVNWDEIAEHLVADVEAETEEA